MTVLRDVTRAAVAMLVSTACLASQADRASTCGPGMTCRLAGTLDIESKWQVSLDQGNRCIALVLPESFHETCRQFDDRKVSVLGSAFSQPHASEGSVLIGYLVDGMRVSPNLCEFAISVDEIAAGDEVVWRRSDDDAQSTGTAALLETAGPSSAAGDAQSAREVHLDLIVGEGGRTTFADPLTLGAEVTAPGDLREAVAALRSIVPLRRSGPSARSGCMLKRTAPLAETYMDCKYAVCELLPERSRIQDCGYLIRVEQWVQREWLGGLCWTDGVDESRHLVKWFQGKGVDDCTAMSELVMVAWMQDVAGIEWNESVLIDQSAVD